MRPLTILIGPALAALLSLSLVLMIQGCAGGFSNIPGFAGQALPPDEGDPCQPERATFATSNSFFTENVLNTAGAAALLGAEAPIEASFSTFNFKEGISEGVAAGIKDFVQSTKASFSDSYSAYVKQELGGDQAQMSSRVGSDLAVEGQARDKTITNFAALRDCRFNQAGVIKEQLRDHTMTRADAKAALAAESMWFDQEIALATKWGVNMQARDEQFAAAAEMVQTPERSGEPAPSGHRAGSHRRTRGGGKSGSVVVAATETIPDKREVLVSTVGQAKTESATAFNVEDNDQSLNLFKRDGSKAYYA